MVRAESIVCWVGLGAVLGACRPPLGPEVRAQARAVAAAVDCDQLDAELDALVARARAEQPDAALAAAEGQPLHRAAALAWLQETLADDGFEVSLPSAPGRHVPVQNLVLRLPGTGAGPGDAPAGERVVLSAHYDSWHGGADDNASGVVSLLQALRALREAGASREILVLFTDREETGLDGALAWWEGRAGARIHTVLNLDAVAYTGPQSAPPGLRLPARGDFILGLANGPARHQLSWLAELSGEIPGSAPFRGAHGRGANELPAATDFHRSDHSPAWAAGVPAVFFTDTANLRNPHYHQPSDTPETLDRGFHCAVTRLVAGGAAAFAEMP